MAHEKAGVLVSGRGRSLLALVAVAAVAGGGSYLQDLGPRENAPLPEASVISGVWFCPHGGGKGWKVDLLIANPGPREARVRVRTFGEGRPTEPRRESVAPGSQTRIEVPAPSRAAGSVVEYFGGWVAAGWVARAGGKETGVAAEPCAPRAGSWWLAPDGTTLDGERAYLVVLNPFDADAVVDVTLFAEDRPEPVLPEKLTDVVIPAQRAEAFFLNPVVFGERTLAASVTASSGRVTVASLGVSETGGARSALGSLGPPPEVTLLPGGGDAGQSSLVVVNPLDAKVTFGARLFGTNRLEGGGVQGQGLATLSCRTYPVVTSGDAAIEVRATGGGLGVARRATGLRNDDGATGGAAPAPAWVVLQAVGDSPATPRLFLANPGTEDSRVRLTLLGGEGGELTVGVPGGRTLAVKRGFLELAPRAAVVAVASEGTFVAVSASSSGGRLGLSGYAVAVGVPIPAGHLPG